MDKRNERRDFLKTTAVAGAGYFTLAGTAPAASRSALERIRFGCIGVGNRGAVNVGMASGAGDIVALCDIDENFLNSSKRRYRRAETFSDYRKMLEKMEKKIDAVTVATPDHQHAVASAMAMKMGKHCYTEKPLTRTIYEARQLSEIAKKHKVVTQMGNQGTSSSGLRKGAAHMSSGTLGKVTEVHVWTNRPVWPQGRSRPRPSDVPSHVNWDLFLGPAPKRPYARGYHPFKWRGWWDFGSGALGDMACHTLNMAFMGLNLRDPISVQAKSSGHNKDSFPKWSEITFEFPALGGRGPVKMVWYDGGKRPSRKLFAGSGHRPWGSGLLVIGDKNTLLSNGDYSSRYTFFKKIENKRVKYTRSPGHFREFSNAIKNSDAPAPVSNFPDYGGPFTETILLGNLAVWGGGKKIEWDAKNLVAKNAPEVSSLIKPEYRKGYSL